MWLWHWAYLITCTSENGTLSSILNNLHDKIVILTTVSKQIVRYHSTNKSRSLLNGINVLQIIHLPGFIQICPYCFIYLVSRQTLCKLCCFINASIPLRVHQPFAAPKNHETACHLKSIELRNLKITLLHYQK